MISAVTCTCGSVDKSIRKKLEMYGYKDWLSIPIPRGKEKSLSHLNTIPQHEGVELLRNHIKKSSKFAVIIGYDDTECRWVDIIHGNRVKTDVESELLVKRFA